MKKAHRPTEPLKLQSIAAAVIEPEFDPIGFCDAIEQNEATNPFALRVTLIG